MSERKSLIPTGDLYLDAVMSNLKYQWGKELKRGRKFLSESTDRVTDQDLFEAWEFSTDECDENTRFILADIGVLLEANHEYP